MFWKVEVYDDIDSLNVNAASKQVCAKQQFFTDFTNTNSHYLTNQLLISCGMHKTITVRLAASIIIKYKWTYVFLDNYPRMVREIITREHVL